MKANKNLHILPTDKSSRLWTNNLRRRLELDEFPEQHPTNIAKNIYITNSEEIKEGDWFLSKERIVHNNWGWNFGDKKIILTTDQDLIKDGVQAIDDEFLEWFVNNPSCEEVEVFHQLHKDEPLYKIIIPKEHPKQIKCYCGHTTYCDCSPLEEPKQETLEKAAKKYAEIYRCPATNKDEYCKHDIISAINFGAKWQQERMYSEEDMVKFAEFVATYLDKNRNVNGEMLHAKSKYDGAERTIDLLQIWFEQFKKK